ncbi:MAG: hypothetical protein WBV48_03620, partial [Candidatus Acidiferrales bacterium]
FAMPSAYWHHDDFLFEKQFPTIEPKESPVTAGDELLARFRRKIRMQSQFTPRPVPQPQSAGVFSKSYYPEIGRTFHPNPKHYLAKHPLQP